MPGKTRGGKKRFFITTPAFYLNDTPHVGHAYTMIVCDCLARWHRLLGRDVFFLTGTDENSVKTREGAKKFGYDSMARYADFMASKWRKAWKELGMSNDDFIRTTSSRHRKLVGEFYKKVLKRGDIYKGSYEGLYCEGCEAFYTEKDLEAGKCPIHKTRPRILKEENYFFRLSAYQKSLLDYIRDNPDFIRPDTRRNEVVSLIRDGLRDISISRPGQDWGIALPNDRKHVFWVWFDALINYISANPSRWPADIQMMAKDILRFHAIVWPAMLMSAGYPLPRAVFAHGFFTVKGEKISKSLGNAIDPLHIKGKFGTDPLRYFLLREIPLGEDGDFSEHALKDRLNNELANDLGNLLSRALTLAEKHRGRIQGEPDPELQKALKVKRIFRLMEALQIHHALDEIWSFIRAVNRYINEKEPWKLEGREFGNVLYNVLESLRIISVLLAAFIPETSEKINRQLGVRPGTLKDLEFRPFRARPRKGVMLFKKVK
jgi:methionyl-tRNA synthetase